MGKVYSGEAEPTTVELFSDDTPPVATIFEVNQEYNQYTNHSTTCDFSNDSNKKSYHALLDLIFPFLPKCLSGAGTHGLVVVPHTGTPCNNSDDSVLIVLQIPLALFL